MQRSPEDGLLRFDWSLGAVEKLGLPVVAMQREHGANMELEEGRNAPVGVDLVFNL